jgi:hypothetical protein
MPVSLPPPPACAGAIEVAAVVHPHFIDPMHFDGSYEPSPTNPADAVIETTGEFNFSQHYGPVHVTLTMNQGGWSWARLMSFSNTQHGAKNFITHGQVDVDPATDPLTFSFCYRNRKPVGSVGHDHISRSNYGLYLMSGGVPHLIDPIISNGGGPLLEGQP